MATDMQVSELFPPPDWDSDALKLYEVVDGKIVEKPPMGAKNSVLARFLQDLMGPFARSNGLGRVVPETLFLIDRARNLKRRPDLAFVSAAALAFEAPRPSKRKAGTLSPTWPSRSSANPTPSMPSRSRSRSIFRPSVRAVWVVLPVTKKVYVYESPTQVRILQVGDTLEGGDLLPGFQVALINPVRGGRRGARAGELRARSEARFRSVTS